MVKSRKRFGIKAMAGIIVVFGVYAGIRLSEAREEHLKKIIVCLDKGEESGEGYSIVDILHIGNMDNFFDYSNQKGTFLYSDCDGKIFEKSILTNQSEEIDIKNVEGYIKESPGKIVRNLKYVPNGKNVSFMLDNVFYVYDYERKKVISERDCLPDSWIEYQWQDSGMLYFIPYDDKWIRNLYLYENLYSEPVYITKGIRSMALDNDGEKIYGIWDSVALYYGSGFEMEHRIVEIDVKTGERKLLQELDSENFILENADDEYLFYVEKKHNKKLSKVYCLDLKNGQKKCIYKTYHTIIGIIVR